MFLEEQQSYEDAARMEVVSQAGSAGNPWIQPAGAAMSAGPVSALTEGRVTLRRNPNATSNKVVASAQPAQGWLYPYPSPAMMGSVLPSAPPPVWGGPPPQTRPIASAPPASAQGGHGEASNAGHAITLKVCSVICHLP